ncbi:MAG: GerAB/ArcD/ProY family transporter [Bacillota bacterium]
MIREGRIGSFETVVALLFSIIGKIYLSYASGIIKENFSAAWLAVFLGCVCGALWFIPLGALLKRFPGDDLVDIGDKALGPVLGKILVGVIILFIFFSTVVTLRQIAETVIGTAMPMAPLLVVTFAIALIMILTALLGFESIARVASIISPYLLVIGVGLFLLQIGNYNVNYLAPLWGPGMGKLAVNGFMRSSLLSELVLLGFMAPMIARKKIAANGFFLIILSTAILTGAMAIGQMIFPPSVAAENAFPFYEIARSIYFGRFYQRLEFLFVLVWITITLLSLSVRFYFAVSGAAKIFKMPYYQPLVYIMGLATLAAAFLFPNYNTAVNWDNLIRGRWAWVPAFAVPFLIYLAALLRGKRGVSHAPKS